MKRVLLTYSNGRKVAPYIGALKAVGIDPVPVSAEEVASLAMFDGLVLSGGPDIDPAIYGQKPEEHTEATVPDRDALELALVRSALERDVPVLAICRGMQLMNIAHRGGTLNQHVEGHVHRTKDPSDPIHPIVTGADTRLAQILGCSELEVNSRHHQAVANVGSGLIVSARAADGVVEGLERPDRRFAVAVQWHPEDQVQRFPVQLRLFEAFRDAL
jgi:putative glutamine amidotransferase